jgi:integration host factor subunit beta
MVKDELTNSLVRAFPGISRQDMLIVVDSLFSSMAQALILGDTIELRGFGRFNVKERLPTKGRNPKTKETIYISKRWVVHFKPADSVGMRING